MVESGEGIKWRWCGINMSLSGFDSFCGIGQIGFGDVFDGGTEAGGWLLNEKFLKYFYVM